MIQARQMCWGLLALLLVQGCVPLEPKRNAPSLRPPRATLVDITAPRRATDEAERLPTTPAGKLRRAWLTSQVGQHQKAVNIANSLIYDRRGQPPSIRSLAYFVRGRAFARLGNRERAREDLQIARSTAIQADLQHRCDKDLVQLGPTIKPTTRPRVNNTSRVAKVHLTPRRSWNAARAIPRKLDKMNGIRKLTIHHSANLATGRHTLTRMAASIRAIQQVHIEQNGWGDIGYHFLIDPAGRIWQGRNLRYQGAHAGGANNRHNIGICLLGNFTGRGQQPPGRQVQAMTDLVRSLRKQHRIPTWAVLTHKEIKAETACPGSRLQAIVNRMRAQFAAAAGGTSARRSGGLAAGGGR